MYQYNFIDNKPEKKLFLPVIFTLMKFLRFKVNMYLNKYDYTKM